MSCVQWDDMLIICMESAEYSNEGAAIEEKEEMILEKVEEANDLTLAKTKTTQKKKREKVLV